MNNDIANNNLTACFVMVRKYKCKVKEGEGVVEGRRERGGCCAHYLCCNDVEKAY